MTSVAPPTTTGLQWVIMSDGLEPFVRDGRIRSYPAKVARRLQVLAWAAEQTWASGESLDEAAVNERLLRLTDDPATLRRYLVDHALVRRAPGGTGYSLAPR